MNMFNTKLSPVEIDQNCPALKRFPEEYWHRNFSIYRKFTVCKSGVYQKCTGSEPEVKYFEIMKDLAVGSLMKVNSSSSYMSRTILVRGVFKLSSLSDWLKYREPSLAQFEIPIEGKIFENQIGKWLLHYGPQYKGEVPLCIHQDIETLGNVNLIITNIFVLVVGVMFLRHFRHSQTLGKMVFSIFHCIKDRFILALESHSVAKEQNNALES